MMFMVLRATLSLALMVGMGRAILELAAPRAAGARSERWALAFLLGAGGISLFSWWLSPLFAYVSSVWVLTSVAVAAMAVAIVTSYRRSSAADGRANDRMSGPGRSDGGRLIEPHAETPAIGRAAIGAILLLCGFVVVVGLVTPLGWDGLFNFEMKARIAFLNAPSGRVPLAYFADESREWSHPQYPLLLPLAEGWLYGWIGQPSQWAAKLLFPPFYLSLLVLFFATVRREASVTWAAAGCLGLQLVPALSVGPGGALTGYADVPLAAMLFGAVAYTRRAWRHGGTAGIPDNEGEPTSRDCLVLAALLAAMAVWTKREGVLLVVLLAASVAAVAASRSGWRGRGAESRAWSRTIFVLVLGPAVVMGPWWLFQEWYGLPGDRDVLPLTVTNVLENLPRVPEVSGALARELVRPGRWAAVWPAFVITTGLSIRRLRGTSDGFVTMLVMGGLTAYVGVFTLSAWPNYAEHIGTALPRLPLPLVPLAWLVTLGHLRRDLARTS